MLACLSPDLNEFSKSSVFNALLLSKALFKVLEPLNRLYSQAIY
jgi:hypothetical protein